MDAHIYLYTNSKLCDYQYVQILIFNSSRLSVFELCCIPSIVWVFHHEPYASALSDNSCYNVTQHHFIIQDWIKENFSIHCRKFSSILLSPVFFLSAFFIFILSALFDPPLFSTARTNVDIPILAVFLWFLSFRKNLPLTDIGAVLGVMKWWNVDLFLR